MQRLSASVDGVYFDNPDGPSRQEIIEKYIHVGDEVILVKNRSGKDSVAVIVHLPGRPQETLSQVGSLDRDISTKVLPHLSGSLKTEAKVIEKPYSKVQGGYGLELEILLADETGVSNGSNSTEESTSNLATADPYLLELLQEQNRYLKTIRDVLIFFFTVAVIGGIIALIASCS